MLLSEAEVVQIKKGNHKVYLWRPKPIVWRVRKVEEEK